MSHTVWKLVLQHNTTQETTVPEDAIFLAAREQHGEIAIWLWCDPSQPVVKRTLMIVPTGASAPHPHQAKYIGPVLFEEGHFVLHIFELFP